MSIEVHCPRCKGYFQAGENWANGFPQYCPACANHFKEFQEAAREKFHKQTGSKTQGFASGKFLCDKFCPELNRVGNDRFCGVCGSKRITNEYGYCVFGLGSYVFCCQCKTVSEFIHDTGE